MDSGPWGIPCGGHAALARKRVRRILQRKRRDPSTRQSAKQKFWKPLKKWWSQFWGQPLTPMLGTANVPLRLVVRSRSAALPSEVRVQKKTDFKFLFRFWCSRLCFIRPLKFRALKFAMSYVMHVRCEMARHGIAWNGVARLHNIATSKHHSINASQHGSSDLNALHKQANK